ncbi:MAG: bifunctional diaminohydroxyphosphoribosylaminopyrimidine deaminase/5-amino-6-(5-phosphoribosylamino)uracil reductase RibD [Myxococcaceae bacterium]|nr:bifunctional diaminohydroxyphosphoribosylaminopyrimidine deaminase/5-amino-6-(5-phosphoribosylamino)uracil reductase RibD [Myxococcaceae bacterium]MBH2006394.1 bifunctional diaminohydroxyphosphoribosylaminopyrimidine deaminase/5-amino-6-(5-phosphoribosylamino)uracil reductase RibD [Myxococcaceae bacterium]
MREPKVAIAYSELALESQGAADSWMAQALEQAKLGLGCTYPNPPVGALIEKEGRIVAQSFHARAGDLHAEAKALLQAGEQALGSTLHVTLEPCNHFGRTPPCTEAIIRAGVKRVIYAENDPNPEVAGQGRLRLQEMGIQVEQASSPESRVILLPFSKRVTRGVPYVIAKMAASLDGRISQKPGVQTALTSPKANRFVHRLRERVDAVVVGSETVLIDNPRLTVRDTGSLIHHQPIRIVLDSRLRTSPQAWVYQEKNAWVVHSIHASKKLCDAFDQAGIQRVVSEKADLLKTLGAFGLTSILVEGGAQVLTYFLHQGWVDELVWLTAPILLGSQGTASVGELACSASFGPGIRADLFPDRLMVFTQGDRKVGSFGISSPHYENGTNRALGDTLKEEITMDSMTWNQTEVFQ